MWPTVVDNTHQYLHQGAYKEAPRAEKNEGEEVGGEGGREERTAKDGWKNARFPHLKHPFLEILYAIYKNVKEKGKTIYNYSFSSNVCFLRPDENGVKLMKGKKEDRDGATKNKERFVPLRDETDLCCRPHNPQHG